MIKRKGQSIRWDAQRRKRTACELGCGSVRENVGECRSRCLTVPSQCSFQNPVLAQCLKEVVGDEVEYVKVNHLSM